MWDASGQTIAVYEASSSGEPQFIIVQDINRGWKKETWDFVSQWKERYAQANGENSWEDYVKGLKNTIDHSWSELLFLHPELGSK